MGLEKTLHDIAVTGELDAMLRSIHSDWRFAVDFEDFRQQVVLIACKARIRHKFESGDDLLPFLHVVGKRVLIDLLRRRKLEQQTMVESGQELVEATPTSQFREPMPIEEILKWAGADLSDLELQVLRNKYWLKNDFKSVSAILRTSYRSVVQAHYRAIKKLREASERRKHECPDLRRSTKV